MSGLAGQHQYLLVEVTDIWLEAVASSQALEPFFPFLSQSLALGLLSNLGCYHCCCLGLPAYWPAPLPFDACLLFLLLWA